ncbi:MAG: DMT family transporter [Betaproteobacteria bacterium]|nr:MAG: DMT family transporter [Betaproteobacteria bacterium]
MPDPVRHPGLDDRRLVLALPRVPRRRGLGAAARLAAADDRRAVAPGRDPDQRAARVGEGLRHRQPLGPVQPLRHPSPDRGAHRRAPGAQQLKALLAWYFVAVWGAGYVATKLGLQYAPPFTFLSLRFFFGLAVLLPIVFIWKAAWPRSRAELGHLAVAGLLMHAVQLGGSHYAQYLGMSAGVAALIISCQPLLTAGVASRFLNERLAPGQWAGVFIGLAGVALVVWHKIDIREVTLGSLAGTLVALAGVTSATLYQKVFSPRSDLKAAAVIQFAASLAVLAPLALAVEGFKFTWAWEMAAAIAFLVIFASILGVMVLYWLLRHGGAARVTSMMYLPPVFAVALELALFGVAPGWLTVLGMAVACGGVAMTLWSPRWRSSTS